MFGSAIDTARVTVARPSPKVKLVAKRTPANGVTAFVAAGHKRAEMQESVVKRLMFPLVPTAQRLTQTGVP